MTYRESEPKVVASLPAYVRHNARNRISSRTMTNERYVTDLIDRLIGQNLLAEDARELALEALKLVAPEELTLHFVLDEDNDDSTEGEITLRRNAWGADLLVDGREIGWVDLWPKRDGKFAQFIVYDQDSGLDGEPLGKIVLATPLTLVVNSNAVEWTCEQPIYLTDAAFVMAPEGD